MTTPHEQAERIFDGAVLFLLGVIGYVGSNFNAILGNIFLMLSISYLVWRWRRDVKRSKEKANGEPN